MKTVLFALLMSALTASYSAYAAKPLSPLRVIISPSQAGISPDSIKPGDIVEFKITGTSRGAEGEMTMKVELIGGVELVSGNTAWAGRLRKGEGNSLPIAVKAPKHGNGIIRARVSMSPSAGASFTAVAEYRFGKFTERKSSQLPEIKKDHKGRSIREYKH